MSTEQPRFLPILNSIFFACLQIILFFLLSQVEQILDIFDVGEDRDEDDEINFSQFHSKVCFNN